MRAIRGAVSGETKARQRGRAFLAVPLILVNLSAVWGQAGWAYDHITAGGIVVALLFAFSVESIGVYLAWESHEALMADQASAFLRFGSYAVGGLVGVLNYLHFSAQSFAIGIAFGALSAISPWLWGIWSRARNRTRLAELGLVDIRGVKLSTARKLWHPVRSVRVLSWAAWEGVTDPADAVAGWARTAAQTETVSETATVAAAADEPEFIEPEPVVVVRRPEIAPASQALHAVPDAAPDADDLEAEIEAMYLRHRKPGMHISREVAAAMVRNGIPNRSKWTRLSKEERNALLA